MVLVFFQSTNKDKRSITKSANILNESFFKTNLHSIRNTDLNDKNTKVI